MLISIFADYTPLSVIMTALIPCAVRGILVAYLFWMSSVYLLIPTPHLSTLPPLSPSITASLFSISVRLFLFCIYLHLYYFLDFACDLIQCFSLSRLFH